MEQTKALPKPYDPVIAVEGMFSGSVTRMGYVFRDPKAFTENTKIVLDECAKRFQDALDDCEIQLLEAKWYLEQKLAQNRADRAAKEKESAAAAAKRKQSESDEVNKPKEEPTESKKVKLEQGDERSIGTDDNTTQEDRTTTEPVKPEPLEAQKTSPQQPEPTKPPPEPSSQPAPSTDSQKPPELTQDNTTQPTLNDTDTFMQSTQPTPNAINENEEFFTSMFGDPSIDGDAADMNNDDMNLGLDLDDAFNDANNEETQPSDPAMTTQNNASTTAQPSQPTQDPSSLSSLLPGLEAFANQTGDGSNDQNADASITNANGFDLPDLGGPNIFDEYLGDGTGADPFAAASNNMNMNMGMSMDGDMDLGLDDVGGDVNFDDLFGDGS